MLNFFRFKRHRERKRALFPKRTLHPHLPPMLHHKLLRNSKPDSYTCVRDSGHQKKNYGGFCAIYEDACWWRISHVKNIRLVMDNLNTHKEKSFYEVFSEEEAKRKRKGFWTRLNSITRQSMQAGLMLPKSRSMWWISNAPTRGSEIWMYWHTKWQDGPKEGMMVRRKSSGSLQVIRLTRNYPSIMFHN